MKQIWQHNTWSKEAMHFSCAQHSSLYQCQVHFLPGTWRFLCGLCTQRTERHKHFIISMKKKKKSYSNERKNKVNKQYNCNTRVHIFPFKIPPSTVISHRENLCPANESTWVTPSLIQRHLNRMWTWMLVSVALDHPLQFMKVSPFLSLHLSIQSSNSCFTWSSGCKEQRYQGER